MALPARYSPYEPWLKIIRYFLILLPITSFSISNLVCIEIIFNWAITIQFGLFLHISFNVSFFSVSSEEVLFTRFMADWSDFSVFPKLVKDLKFIWESNLEASWKLSITIHVFVNFLVLLLKLIVSLQSLLDSNVTLLCLVHLTFYLHCQWYLCVNHVNAH